MSTWSELEQELDRWQSAGRVATFCWRDDDAHDATPELEPLLDLSIRHVVPVHLAVIPQMLRPALAQRLKGCVQVQTLQHGFAHVNHEPKGHGASEFGDTRKMALQLRDLQAGWDILLTAGLPNLVKGFVPPWNRMSGATLARLPALGYRVVSAYEGHTPAVSIPGLIRADGQVDPIRWKKGRVFRGAEAMLGLVLRHLTARREGRVPVDEPTVVLTHHLETGSDIWDFSNALCDRLARHDAAQWITLAALTETADANHA